MWVIEEFENQIVKDIQDDSLNGSISITIVKHDNTIWSKAFGPVDRNGNRLANTDTLYRAGSVTKSFTAFLMMQLVQENIIQLDQPVEDCFPEVRKLEGYSASTIFTFRQLASHTAGLVREPRLEGAASGPIEEWEEKVLQSIPTTSFESKPGERFGYSNIGYGILGVALSRAAHRPFIEMIEEKILKPFQMENSFFVVPQHKLDNLAQGIGGGPFGEEDPDVELPKKEHRGRGYKVPNGGLYSTPSDLAKFLMGVMGYTGLLEKQHMEILHARHTPEASNHGYGFGFELYQDCTISIAGHAGGVWGYSSYFGFEKKHRYGVILMRNYNWGATSWDVGPKILLRKLMDYEKENEHVLQKETR